MKLSSVFNTVNLASALGGAFMGAGFLMLMDGWALNGYGPLPKAMIIMALPAIACASAGIQWRSLDNAYERAAVIGLIAGYAAKVVQVNAYAPIIKAIS